jgi:hypothetical protein
MNQRKTGGFFFAISRKIGCFAYFKLICGGFLEFSPPWCIPHAENAPAHNLIRAAQLLQHVAMEFRRVSGVWILLSP